MKVLSAKVHTIIGLIVGVVLFLAPAIFGFGANQAATLTAQLVGVFIVFSELITTSKASLLKVVPMRVHLVLDYATGIFLAISPWLFGFASMPANEWVPHLIVGVLVVGYALITNPAAETTEAKVAAM
ncbi:MAG TPA: SPW repeat protein [Candidatus Saccharimonadales bacterium]|nr:SPW repeat protein [Candidatus Saccharimonadales bacterium]